MKNLSAIEKEFWSRDNIEEAKKIIGPPSTWNEDIALHIDFIAEEIRTAKDIILEIGCGIGRLMSPLSEMTKEVWGTDISETMIRHGKKYLMSKINCFFIPIDQLSKFSEVYDMIYSVLCFQHIHDIGTIREYLKLSHRVLKPRGRIKIQNYINQPESDHPFRGYSFSTVDEFVSEFEKAGFEVIKKQADIIHEEWVWITGEK
jgi:cyclopropane fatty-acyl-phospholipid synthase-like methyltransferase